MHFILWIIIYGSWKISWDFDYAYRLHLLNYPPSWTPPCWLTHVSKYFVCITHNLQHNTMELFLIEKNTNNKCTLLLKRFAKGIWVRSMIMTPQMLDILVRFSKQVMMFFKCWHEKMLMYLLNNLFCQLTHHKQC